MRQRRSPSIPKSPGHTRRLEAREGEKRIVIAGSLFLVGEALDRLGFAHVPQAKTPKELVLQ